MRIVHAVTNIAGIPTILARAQREQGHQVSAILYRPGGGPDEGTVHLNRLVVGGRISGPLRTGRMVLWLASHYDVLHFHYHLSLWPMHRDLAVYRAMGRKLIFHLHGCDIRDPHLVRRNHAISACAGCTIPCLNEWKVDLPRALERYADAVIVSTPDLLEFVPDATYIPNPLDRTPWERLRTASDAHRERGPWIIVHAPTQRHIKGTKYVIEAVEKLREEGLPVELRLLEGMTHDELAKACADADVAVDQVLIGWIGQFSLEMMALGKPVIAYVRPELHRLQPDLPVAASTPTALADTLRDLLLASQRRRELADRGPAWVREHHDVRRISSRILDLYGSVGAR
jgi:glycosyltransferase involved in cell wall biosynthesis